MAADVSSLLRLLSGYKDDRAVVKESAGAISTAALMTRDLLGTERGGDRSLELDLDLQVPTGYEKRLDLKVRVQLIPLFFFLDFVDFKPSTEIDLYNRLIRILRFGDFELI